MAVQAEPVEQQAEIDLDHERVLLLRYRQGDSAVFDELYRRYFAPLYEDLKRQLGDAHLAEELAQEAFARTLRAKPDGDVIDLREGHGLT